MKKLTILTPTFNRSKELKKLYKSLLNQTSKDFLWLIIDDGSIDDTEKVVRGFKEISIEYIKKQNGGKHTALNTGFKNLKSELVIIVDSDDYLVETAVELILSKWEKYYNNKKLCGMVFKKKLADESGVSDNFREDEFIDNYNKYVINNHIKGDKAEVFKSSLIKKYSYPEFENEKFVGEGVLWSKISRKYDMLFVNQYIYICDYLDGGLTKSGRKMRINNPKGGMFHAEEYLDKIYDFKTRIKNALLYLTYARFDKNNIIKTIIESNYKGILIINIIPSFFLFHYWNFKYKK